MVSKSKRALAILQNQWFHNPERVKQLIEKSGEPYRRRLVHYALFAGCLTGRRLKQIFGDRINDIIWDEASKEIGGKASSCFTPDKEHVQSLIDEYQPKVILAFGNVAAKAIPDNLSIPIIYAPHPAARGKDTIPSLKRAAEELNKRLE